MKERTKEQSEWLHGCPMKPCPVCGSWNFKYQMPVELGLTGEETARGILSKWAKAYKTGGAKLKGPVFMMCFRCGHHGPSVDCSGRTSEEVGCDPNVAKEVKRLWNSQEGPK